MKFLANENFPFPSIQFLSEQGFEVVSISEGMGGMKDRDVLEKAVKEDLVILTFDRDYGELLFKYSLIAPPAIVYFRLEHDRPEDAGRILVHRMLNDNLRLIPFFTVIEEEGTRQRQLN